MNPKLLVATRNPGKRREIVQLLTDIPYDLVFPDDRGLWEKTEEASVEDADSFEGNARRKAEYFARRSRLPTVAEDSGLEVFALGGAPGVRSRRFAFPTPADPREQDGANNAELLRRLASAPEDRRRARYRCVVCFLERPDGMPQLFEGSCVGRILTAPEGTGGFGYDPLFFSDDLGKGFGVATPEEKDGVSHRGRAFRAFAEWLRARGVM
jgi:XTP/dITP diphosphohydrolase